MALEEDDPSSLSPGRKADPQGEKSDEQSIGEGLPGLCESLMAVPCSWPLQGSLEPEVPAGSRILTAGAGLTVMGALPPCTSTVCLCMSDTFLLPLNPHQSSTFSWEISFL